MARKKVKRPCATHDEWKGMSLEKKVEVLGKWAKLMTEWAEETHEWQENVKTVMHVLHQNSKGLMDATKPWTVKDTNGGPPPPKHPKDPGC